MGGAGIVDVAHDAAREAELDRLITRRHDERVKDEGHRPSEELYEESTRRYNLKRELEMRRLWADFHREQAERVETNARLIAARHRAQVEVLLGEPEQTNGHRNGESA